MTVVIDPALLTPDTDLTVGVHALAGWMWSIPVGGDSPDRLSPIRGALKLAEADNRPRRRYHRNLRRGLQLHLATTRTRTRRRGGGGVGDQRDRSQRRPAGLVRAAQPDHRTDTLNGIVIADDLSNTHKRVPFPLGATIGAGQHMIFAVDKNAWPGFALGSDEELGIWTVDGTLIDSVDWDDDQAEHSYARQPDSTAPSKPSTPPPPQHPTPPDPPTTNTPLATRQSAVSGDASPPPGAEPGI